jgi:predicted transcriptional regulator
MDELAQTSVDFSALGDSSLIANQKWIKANAGSEKICANELVSEVSIEFLKRSKVTISPNAFGYVTVDIDTTAMIAADTSATGCQNQRYDACRTHQGSLKHSPPPVCGRHQSLEV